MTNWDDDRHQGNIYVELVKTLLDARTGYSVYLNGYEERFSQIKECLRDNKNISNSRTVRLIRSSPDLMVFDKVNKDVFFVEVKKRNAPNEHSVLITPDKIARYKEFWSDAILVIVIPHGEVFYAQRFSELESIKKGNLYDAETDFRKFEDFFVNVDKDALSRYKKEAKEAITKQANK